MQVLSQQARPEEVQSPVWRSDKVQVSLYGESLVCYPWNTVLEAQGVDRLFAYDRVET